jgi:hypothetical protein
MALPASYYPKEYKDRWTEWAIEQGVGKAYICMLEGAAHGIQPSIAIRVIHVINGVPTLSAGFMFGRMLATGILRRDDYTLEASKTEAKLTIGILTRKPENRLVVIARFEDFKHLHGKDNWRNDPEGMLVARVQSRGSKRHAPDLFVGVYSSEEIRDLREDMAAGAEVPAELYPEPLPEAPVSPPAPAEPVAQATAKTGPTREELAAEYTALLDLLPKVPDSITPEEVKALRGRVEAFSTKDVAYGKLMAAWDANGNLNPAQEPS